MYGWKGGFCQIDEQEDDEEVGESELDGIHG